MSPEKISNIVSVVNVLNRFLDILNFVNTSLGNVVLNLLRKMWYWASSCFSQCCVCMHLKSGVNNLRSPCRVNSPTWDYDVGIL